MVAAQAVARAVEAVADAGKRNGVWRRRAIQPQCAKWPLQKWGEGRIVWPWPLQKDVHGVLTGRITEQRTAK